MSELVALGEWRLRDGSQEWPAGSIETLRQWARDGRISPEMYVWNPTLEKWMYARDTAELQGMLSRAVTVCPYCGEQAVKRVEGLQGVGENVAGLFLVAFLFIPALIYYFVVTSQPYCTNCHRRVKA